MAYGLFAFSPPTALTFCPKPLPTWTQTRSALFQSKLPSQGSAPLPLTWARRRLLPGLVIPSSQSTPPSPIRIKAEDVHSSSCSEMASCYVPASGTIKAEAPAEAWPKLTDERSAVRAQPPLFIPSRSPFPLLRCEATARGTGIPRLGFRRAGHGGGDG
jgi:hypothetical protein